MQGKAVNIVLIYSIKKVFEPPQKIKGGKVFMKNDLQIDKYCIKDNLEKEINILYEKYKDDEETIERLEMIRISYYYLFNMVDNVTL